MKDVDILIFGATRSGKTTLARMLSERFHYPVIHKDALVDAMQKIYGIPEATLAVGRTIGTEGFDLFLHRYLRQSKRVDNYSTRYILEGTLPFKDCRRFFHLEKNIVYFLGITELSPEELFDKVRRNDTGKDWTALRSDKQLLKDVANNIEWSKRDKDFCAKYNIPFIETGGDREKILASLVDEIAARIREIDGKE